MCVCLFKKQVCAIEICMKCISTDHLHVWVLSTVVGSLHLLHIYVHTLTQTHYITELQRETVTGQELLQAFSVSMKFKYSFHSYLNMPSYFIIDELCWRRGGESYTNTKAGSYRKDTPVVCLDLTFEISGLGEFCGFRCCIF